MAEYKGRNNFDSEIIDLEVNSGHGGIWFKNDPEDIHYEIIGWCVWYSKDDNTATVIRSDEGLWRNLPREGVQAVVLQHPGGVRTMITGRDEYCFPGEEHTLLGLMIEEEQHDAIYDLAKKDSWRAS